jgi:hypothetical protein
VPEDDPTRAIDPREAIDLKEAGQPQDREDRQSTIVGTERLTVKQTATGYWVVERGAVQLTGATTRRAAEAERELLRRLHDRRVRRLSPRRGQVPRPLGSRPLGSRPASDRR